MKVIEKPLESVRPYEKNPRKNDSAVDAVAASIREFGFKVPIVIDGDGIIVAGHTRYKAAQKLGLKKVPCIVADDLTEDQVKAFRLADNKVGELAGWDFDLLATELQELSDFDMTLFNFDTSVIGGASSDWFDREHKDGADRQEGNEEYNAFLDKFDIKKTTDDCYTPEPMYEAVAGWVAKEYGVGRKDFVRPFYPGGDYQSEEYTGKIVVDNPPFSILAEILKFYTEHGVRFFLFGPTLTLFSSSSQNCTAVAVYGSVTYENGAIVNTSFLTNLDDPEIRVRTAPELYRLMKEADEMSRTTRELPSYVYPDEVITAATVAKWSRYGVDFKVTTKDSLLITALDAQREQGKTIYGKGYLLSERAAAERAAAERAAAERAAAERAAAEQRETERYALSERERELVRQLGA